MFRNCVQKWKSCVKKLNPNWTNVLKIPSKVEKVYKWQTLWKKLIYKFPSKVEENVWKILIHKGRYSVRNSIQSISNCRAVVSPKRSETMFLDLRKLGVSDETPSVLISKPRIDQKCQFYETSLINSWLVRPVPIGTEDWWHCVGFIFNASSVLILNFLSSVPSLQSDKKRIFKELLGNGHRNSFKGHSNSFYGLLTLQFNTLSDRIAGLFFRNLLFKSLCSWL